MNSDSYPALSLGLTTGVPVKLAIELSGEAENNNYHRIWIGDDILKEEVFTYTSIIANHTSRIGLGIAVVSPYAYHSFTIASASATINELLNGKFILGLGVGGKVEIEKLTGIRPKDVVTKMRNTTIIIKKIFNGEKVSFEDRTEKLVGFSLPRPKYKTLVFYGVRGPKLLALAGEIADGVIFSVPLSLLKESIRITEESAISYKRDPKLLRKVLWNGFILSDNRKDIDLAKNVAVVIVSSLSESMLIKSKINLELSKIISSEYMKNNIDAAKSYIDDDLIRKLCFFGSIDEIKNEFSKLSRLGIDEVVIGPPYGSDPAKVIRTMNPNNLWRR